jgi:hypothetical protein
MPRALPRTAWTRKCLEILEAHSAWEGDIVLCWLVRHASIAGDAVEAAWNDHGAPMNEAQVGLVFMALDSQLAEYQRTMPPWLASGSTCPRGVWRSCCTAR